MCKRIILSYLSRTTSGIHCTILRQPASARMAATSRTIISTWSSSSSFIVLHARTCGACQTSDCAVNRDNGITYLAIEFAPHFEYFSETTSAKKLIDGIIRVIAMNHSKGHFVCWC